MIVCAVMLVLTAQSQTTSSKSGGMTDEEVIAFVVKERQTGTSDAQIVTKLMQNGVDIAQIRRIKEKYQSSNGKNSVIGEANFERSRMNNGKTREEARTKKSDLTLPEGMDIGQVNMFGGMSGIGSITSNSTYNEIMMAQYMDDFEIDSMSMLRAMLEEQRKKIDFFFLFLVG